MEREPALIQHRFGSLITAGAEALVNTVNCVGIMGKGVALQFKLAFPDNYEAYRAACEHGEVKPGKMFIFERTRGSSPRFIINFPTKRHWKEKSRLDDISAGLDALREDVVALKVKSIAIPPLGCGNGGLNWRDVEPLINSKLGDLRGVSILVHPPQTAPSPTEMPVATAKPRMTRARSSVVVMLSRYQQLTQNIGRIEAQKLAYFLQEAGEPLNLKFVQGRFGPYSDALSHVLSDMEGHYIRGFGDRQAPSEIIVPDDARKEAISFARRIPELRTRHERVWELIRGFESTFGLELLATVHWVGTKDPEAAHDCEMAIAAVQGWSEAKRLRFSPMVVGEAWSALHEKGWWSSTRLDRFGN